MTSKGHVSAPQSKWLHYYCGWTMPTKTYRTVCYHSTGKVVTGEAIALVLVQILLAAKSQRLSLVVSISRNLKRAQPHQARPATVWTCPAIPQYIMTEGKTTVSANEGSDESRNKPRRGRWPPIVRDILVRSVGGVERRRGGGGEANAVSGSFCSPPHGSLGA